LAGVDPEGNHGCLLEVTTESGELEYEVAPGVVGRNFDGTDQVAVVIQNVSGGATAVQLWLSGFAKGFA
jgi:hypothetical protein